MGWWGWVAVYFGWVGLGGHFLWVGEGEWDWVEVYFESVGVGGHFLWVSGGGWRYILSGGGRWTFFRGGWRYILHVLEFVDIFYG